MSDRGHDFSFEIADSCVHVVADRDLPDFARVLERFPTTKAEPTLTVRIDVGEGLRIVASLKARLLTITYSRALSACKPLPAQELLLLEITVLQAVSRFLALVLRSRLSPWVLMHGTTVRLDSGIGVALLDDGSGLGKTSLGVALCQIGGAMVADEFAFVNVERRIAVGGQAWPVHLRSDVAKVLLTDGVSLSEVHLSPDRIGLLAASSTELNAILFPRVTGTPCCRKLTRSDTLDRLSRASTDHIRKFSTPGADRASALGRETPALDFDCGPLLVDCSSAENLCRGLAPIPSFEVTLGSPNDLRDTARTLSTMLAPLASPERDASHELIGDR
jgi:hypothetical protein